MAFTHLADASYMRHASWGDKLEILFQAWARVQQPLAQQSIHWIEAIEGECLPGNLAAAFLELLYPP